MPIFCIRDSPNHSVKSNILRQLIRLVCSGTDCQLFRKDRWLFGSGIGDKFPGQPAWMWYYCCRCTGQRVLHGGANGKHQVEFLVKGCQMFRGEVIPLLTAFLFFAAACASQQDANQDASVRGQSSICVNASNRSNVTNHRRPDASAPSTAPKPPHSKGSLGRRP
jgi:hypothetical protein